MDFTREDVLRISELAKIPLTEDEVELFSPQLAGILDHFKELSEVFTDDVLPTSQTTELVDMFREDNLKNSSSLSSEEALSQAQSTHNGYFKVPYVFESSKQENI